MLTALKEIQQQLKENSSTEAKAAHNKFLPGKDKVYGVRMPVLNAIAKQYKSGGFPLVLELWKSGALEEKILAAKILGTIAKKDPEQTLKLVELFSKNSGNWAVCDTIGMQSVKPLVKTHQNEIFDLAKKLNNSKNFWDRRLSLVLVEYYTRFQDLHPEINKLVANLTSDDEYYVKKAVQWINKNMAKGK